MSRQPEKGKSAIQMICDIEHEKRNGGVSIHFDARNQNYWCLVDAIHVAEGDTPELAARALLRILRSMMDPTEKKKLDRGGVK